MVCPYNRLAPVSFHLDDQRKAELEALADSDADSFRSFTKHSAMSRIKYWQWRRNIDVCK
jgi:epoxyqueuosine reductase QueG